jgi:hypothetical protein
LTISNTKTLPCTEPHTSPRTRPQSTCKTTNQCADNLITIIAAQNSEMPKCIKIQAPTEPPRASCPTQQNQTHNKPTCYTHDSKQLLQKAFRQPPQARYQKNRNSTDLRGVPNSQPFKAEGLGPLAPKQVKKEHLHFVFAANTFNPTKRCNPRVTSRTVILFGYCFAISRIAANPRSLDQETRRGSVL